MDNYNSSLLDSRIPSSLRDALLSVGNDAANAGTRQLMSHRRGVFEKDTRYDLERAGVAKSGHFIFERGYHTDRFFAFSSLSRYPEGASIIEFLARRLDALTSDIEYDYIVTHGFEMSRIATAIARLSQRPQPPHQLHVKGSRELSFFGTRGELKGAKVLLLLNVVNTGALMESLVGRIQDQGGSVVKIASIVDLGRYRSSLRSRFLSLVREEVRLFRDADHCTLCTDRVRADYVDLDYESESPRSSVPITTAEIDRHLAGVLGDERDFWQLAVHSGAIVKHRIVGDSHISPAIDLDRFLVDDTCRAWLSARLLRALTPLAGTGSWTIMSAPRKDSSATLAQLVQELAKSAFGQRWPILKARIVRGFIEVKKGSNRGNFPDRVLVIDAGACRGRVLKGVFGALRNLGVSDFAACVAIDRTETETSAELARLCKSRFVGLVDVPFPTIRTEGASRCHACWKGVARRAFKGLHPHELVRRFLAPPFFHRPLVPGRKRRVDMRRRQRQLFDSVSLPEFESLLFAVALQQHMPDEYLENIVATCLGQDTVGVRHRTALIDVLSPNYLSRPKIQDSLMVLAKNSVPPSLLEAACTGLARASRFDWFDENWLASHDEIFKGAAEPRLRPTWLFLAYVLEQAKSQGREFAGRLGTLLSTYASKSEVEEGSRRSIRALIDVVSPDKTT